MHWQQAVRCHQQGDLTGAEQHCRALLAAQPEHADGWHLLGVALSGLGKHQEAIDSLKRALVLAPGAACWNNLGEAQRAHGDLSEALTCVTRALALAPHLPEAHYNRGNILKAMGQHEQAVECYKQAVQLRPGYARAHFNLGNALREQGLCRSAIAAYRQALALRPDWTEVHINVGNAHADLQEWDEALGAFERALQLAPQQMDLHASIGNVLINLGRLDEARQSYEREAQADAKGWWKRLRIAGLLNPVPASNDVIDQDRQKLASVVEELRGRRSPLDLATLHTSGIEPPMALAYHGRDERPLRENYFALLGDLLPPLPLEPGTGKPHVGIVVTRGHEGVFQKCLGSLVDRLPTKDLRISIVCSRSGANIMRQWLRHPELRYLVLPERLDETIPVLQSARLDWLHFWEVGTDTSNYLLPYLRGAPRQSTTWGWPVTTGNPRVDFYISSALLEPEGAEAHYTEKLIKLPSLPTYYMRPRLQQPGRDRASWGFSAAQHVYLCSQNLRKFHPDFDPLIAGILRRDPHGVFVMLGDKRADLTSGLLERFERTMPDVFARVRVMPRLEEQDYLALLTAVHVILDTPHYGGGANTLYDAAAMGTPVVTLPGAYHRGRFGLAVARVLGLPELAPPSAEEYIAQAVKLACDADYRRTATEQIRKAGNQLFEDQEAVIQLREFFLQSIQR